MSLGFNAWVRRIMNERGFSYDEAVREANVRAQRVRAANKRRREHDKIMGQLRPHARAKNPFDGVESPRRNE